MPRKRLETAAAARPPAPDTAHGRHDAAARRKAQRRGRERGCWVYISGEALNASPIPADVVPFYRVWGGARGRYIVTLYPEP